MLEKRKAVLKNRIKKAIFPKAIREKNSKVRVYESIRRQMEDIGVLDDTLINPEETEELEQQYQKLVNDYKGVQVHFLFNLALGAFVQTFLIAEKCNAGRDGFLHVMVPASLDVATGEMKLPNPCVPEFFRYLYLPNRDNRKLYLYLLNRHLDDIDIMTWSQYAPGSLEADGSKDAYLDYRDFHAIRYSEEEKRKGDAYLAKIGITGPYVSFRNRVAKGGSLGGVRNGDTSTYYRAVGYLQQNGIQCVYVGLNENDEKLQSGIIDASKQYDARMDLYIHSKAIFFMGDHSGIIAFAQLFNVPLILLNLPYFTMSGDAYGPTFYERDILLPERIWDTHHKRYLTIRQMLYFEMKYPEYKDLVDFYTAHGYAFHKNTDEDILGAVEEMLLKVQGKWSASPEDLRLQDRYLKIMNDNARKYEAKWCRAAIGAKFLRENQWLLD